MDRKTVGEKMKQVHSLCMLSGGLPRDGVVFYSRALQQSWPFSGRILQVGILTRTSCCK